MQQRGMVGRDRENIRKNRCREVSCERRGRAHPCSSCLERSSNCHASLCGPGRHLMRSLISLRSKGPGEEKAANLWLDVRYFIIHHDLSTLFRHVTTTEHLSRPRCEAPYFHHPLFAVASYRTRHCRQTTQLVDSSPVSPISNLVSPLA